MITIKGLKKIGLFIICIFCLVVVLSYYFSDKSKTISASNSQSSTVPSYYTSVKKLDDQRTLYSFNNINNSSGKKEIVYRVFDGSNFYNATANGNYEENDILSANDMSVEKPQPWIRGSQGNFTNDVDANIVGPDVTIQYKFSGQYLFNYAGSYNGYGANAINSFGGFIYDSAGDLSVPLLDANYGSSQSILGTPDSVGNPKTFNLATGKLEEGIKGMHQNLR